MKFQAVKGMRDFYPAEMAVRTWIMQAWREISQRHGFEEFDGPIFEYLDLYRAKSGEGIVSELFHLEDRAGRELAVRPELTPTLARMVGARANALPRPIKWFGMPRVCRAERPQRGRLREFFQWNIDIVGVDDPVADAECIFVILDLFAHLGLTPAEVQMRINSRALLAALLLARGFEVDRHGEIYAALDKRDKLPEPAYCETLEKITRSPRERDDLDAIMQARGPEGLASLEAMCAGNPPAVEQIERLRRVFALLDGFGVGGYCFYDMGVVRGLAYYTGVVFEGFSRGGLQRAICGGGRYDNLLEVLGGPALSGIGFGTSDVVILDVLEEFGKVPAEARRSGGIEYFVIDADAALYPEVLRLTGTLRRAGRRADFSYRRQNLGKQLKQACDRGAAHAVIVGGEFTQRGVLQIKNLTSGQQLEVEASTWIAQFT